jgi:acyl-CoA thioesterase
MESQIQKLGQILNNDRFARKNAIKLVSVGQGEAIAEMTVSEDHLNGVGIVQGGALFTLADFAFAAASNSSGRLAVASHASISFFRGVSGGTLRAVARQISTGQTLGTYAVDILDEAGTQVAFFTGTAFSKGNY